MSLGFVPLPIVIWRRLLVVEIRLDASLTLSSCLCLCTEEAGSFYFNFKSQHFYSTT